MKIEHETEPEEKKGKEDARILRTKRDLVNALEELLQEKRYDDLSVKDITEKALISKNTFYNNFNEKNDLLMLLFDRQFQKLYDEILPLFKKFLTLQRIAFHKKFIQIIVRYFYASTLPIFKMIKEDQSHSVFYCLNVFAQKTYRAIDSNYGRLHYSKISSDTTILFYSGAFVSVLYYNVLNKSPIDENKMIKDLTKLALPVIR